MEKRGRKKEGRDTVNEYYFLNDPVSPQEEENMKGKAKMNKLRCEITYCIRCSSPEQLIGCIHLECYRCMYHGTEVAHRMTPQAPREKKPV